VAPREADVPKSPEAAGMLRGALVERLARVLPEAMVPTRWSLLAELPRTPNGKTDRRALSQLPVSAPMARDATAAPPRTKTEATVAQVWSHVLGLERVGVDEDFFQAGGHSLLAARVATRLRRLLSIDLPLAVLFER